MVVCGWVATELFANIRHQLPVTAAAAAAALGAKDIRSRLLAHNSHSARAPSPYVINKFTRLRNDSYDTTQFVSDITSVYLRRNVVRGAEIMLELNKFGILSIQYTIRRFFHSPITWQYASSAALPSGTSPPFTRSPDNHKIGVSLGQRLLVHGAIARLRNVVRMMSRHFKRSRCARLPCRNLRETNMAEVRRSIASPLGSRLQ